MRTIRAVVGTLCVLGMTLAAGLPSAVARQGTYTPGAPIFGDLVIEGEDRGVGAVVALVGEGFGPESTVMANIRSVRRGKVVMESSQSADAAGAIRVEVELVKPIRPGAYTATLLGVAPDGAMVELTAALVVESEVPVSPTPEIDPSAPTPVQPNPTPEGQATLPPPAPPSTDDDADVAGATVEPTSGSDDDGTGQDGDDDAADDEAADEADDEQAAAGGTDAADDGGSGAGVWVGVIAGIALLGGGTTVLLRRRGTQA